MTTASTMLDASPDRPPVDTQLHADTIDALLEASRTVRQCAHACLGEPDGAMERCATLDLDVADLTGATANMVIRLADPTAVVAALAACRAALRACADACHSDGTHLRHCAICAEVCERTEEQCLRLEAALGHLESAGRPARPATASPSEPELDITAGAAGHPPVHLIPAGDIGDGAD